MESETTTPPSGEERKPLEASFLQFLSGMAAQALMHLGVISNPLTNKVDVDLANARYSIDLLAVLQEKTRGNLTPEEDQYLNAALHELRLRYVDATQSGGGHDAKADDASTGDDPGDADASSDEEKESS